jgi:hypothetical protein
MRIVCPRPYWHVVRIVRHNSEDQLATGHFHTLIRICTVEKLYPIFCFSMPDVFQNILFITRCLLSMQLTIHQMILKRESQPVCSVILHVKILEFRKLLLTHPRQKFCQHVSH